MERFRKEINEAAELTEDDLLPKIMIDVPMPLDYIKEKLIRELSVLEPFGKANTKPVFADRNLKILRAQIIGRNRNVLKMLVQNASGCTMKPCISGIFRVLRITSGRISALRSWSFFCRDGRPRWSFP